MRLFSEMMPRFHSFKNSVQVCNVSSALLNLFFIENLENSNKIVIAPGSASTILKRFSMHQSSESLHEFRNIINDSRDCLHPSQRELHSVNECLQEFRERKVHWILRDP
jgi:hypothetical protein